MYADMVQPKMKKYLKHFLQKNSMKCQYNMKNRKV